MGDVWLRNTNNEIDKIMNDFQDKNIIILPQTIYFENEKNMSKMEKLFAKQKNLTICTREEYSYKLAKEKFSKNNIILCPDMAFFLLYKKDIKKDENTNLLLFRRDKEKLIGKETEKEVIEKLEKQNVKIQKDDTVINKRIFKFNRKKYLNKLLSKIKKSEIVITDRLHGMLLTVITGTKCIAFSNNNYKIKGEYNWIKDLKTLKYIENIEEFEKAYDELVSIKSEEFKLQDFELNYKDLINYLNTIL